MVQRLVSVFRDLERAGDRERQLAYLLAKIAALGGVGGAGRALLAAPDRALESFAAGVLGGGLDPLPIVSTGQHPELSPPQRTLAASRTACLIEEVNRRSPLVAGEVLGPDADAVSYLGADWYGYPAGTPVLTRVTSHARLHYLVPGVTVRGGDIVFLDGDLAPPALGAPAAAGLNWGAASRKLADGLAGLLPPPANVIGGTIIALLFPSPPSLSWAQIAQQLETIIKEALQQETIAKTATVMNGVVNFLTTEYKNMKADRRTKRAQLQAALAPYDHDCYTQVVSVFIDARYELAAAANFALAAGVHLGLLQERALVDPNHVRDPKGSPFAATVADQARIYAAHAEAVAPRIVDRRLAQIGPVKGDSQTHCHGGPAASCVTDYWFWFEDSNNGYRSKEYSYNSMEKHPPDARGDARRARDAYVSTVRSTTQADVKANLLDVAAAWRRLIDDPVPTPATGG